MLFHQKKVEYFPVIRNSHTVMQIIACFTITTSKAGTKINCRRNRKEIKIEVGETGVGEMGVGETGVGKTGVGETGIPHFLVFIYTMLHMKESFYIIT